MLPIPSDFKPKIKDRCTMCASPMFVKQILEKFQHAYHVKIKCSSCGIEWQKTILT